MNSHNAIIQEYSVKIIIYAVIDEGHLEFRK